MSVFSRIVAGQIPSVKVYEDDATFAFMDIAPATRGHTLVISRAEHPDLYSIPPETLAAVHITVQKVARAIQIALQPDGMNIIQNNGSAAGQTVFHYHVHLIPRWAGDNALPLWRPHPSEPGELRTLADQIRAAFG